MRVLKWACSRSKSTKPMNARWRWSLIGSIKSGRVYIGKLLRWWCGERMSFGHASPLVENGHGDWDSNVQDGAEISFSNGALSNTKKIIHVSLLVARTEMFRASYLSLSLSIADQINSSEFASRVLDARGRMLNRSRMFTAGNHFGRQAKRFRKGKQRSKGQKCRLPSLQLHISPRRFPQTYPSLSRNIYPYPQPTALVWKSIGVFLPSENNACWSANHKPIAPKTKIYLYSLGWNPLL